MISGEKTLYILQLKEQSSPIKIKVITMGVLNNILRSTEEAVRGGYYGPGT